MLCRSFYAGATTAPFRVQFRFLEALGGRGSITKDLRQIPAAPASFWDQNARPDVSPNALSETSYHRSSESNLLVCRRRRVRWGGLRLDDVSNRAVAFQPALVHPRQHRNIVVHIVVDLHESFVVVEAMQPAHILLQGALPGDRHGQE